MSTYSKKHKSDQSIFTSDNINSRNYLNSIFLILGGMKALNRKIESRLDLIEIVQQGITKNAYEHLANYLNYTTKQMATILPITERTIQRYNKSNHFNPEVSDHILQIAEVAAKGIEVFNDKNKLLSWMNYPCVSFSNKTPMSLLSSKFGVDMILDELGRIEHGVFS